MNCTLIQTSDKEKNKLRATRRLNNVLFIFKWIFSVNKPVQMKNIKYIFVAVKCTSCLSESNSCWTLSHVHPKLMYGRVWRQMHSCDLMRKQLPLHHQSIVDVFLSGCHSMVFAKTAASMHGSALLKFTTYYYKYNLYHVYMQIVY